MKNKGCTRHSWKADYCSSNLIDSKGHYAVVCRHCHRGARKNPVTKRVTRS